MNCPYRNEEQMDLLLDYTAGRLDPAGAARLRTHATTCPECDGFLRAQTVVWKALDEFTAPPPTSDFNRAVWRRIGAATADTWLTRLLQICRPLVPLTAAAVLIAAGFVYDHKPASLTITVAEAEQVQHTLEDLQMLQKLNASAAELPEPLL